MPIFESLSDNLEDIFSELRRHGKLSESDVDSAMREIRLALLEADVHYSVVKAFVRRVRERCVGAEVQKSLTPGQQVVKIVHDELIRTLGEPGRLKLAGNTPHVVMLVGLQGSGKTTTAAKLALNLRREGQKPLLVAADTYRPAAVDQLIALGKQIDIPVYDEGVESSPPDIALHGLDHARRENDSVIIVDTAGRLQIDETMMDELATIRERISPDEVLLVADAMTGQEAVNIAQGFNEQVGITGLILTKVDGDARGGAAISMREVTGVPIKFLGTSEKLDGLEDFHPDRLASRILGMGDVLTLIEKAEETYDLEQAEAAVEKLRTASFDLEDFLEQFQQLRKMGPLQQLVSMLPGAGQALRDVQVDEKDLNRVEAIIRSMTPAERRAPKLISGSRKRRIAAGSGTRPQDVNAVLKQYSEAQKMMKMIAGGKNPVPGIPLPGIGRRQKR